MTYTPYEQNQCSETCLKFFIYKVATLSKSHSDKNYESCKKKIACKHRYLLLFCFTLDTKFHKYRNQKCSNTCGLITTLKVNTVYFFKILLIASSALSLTCLAFFVLHQIPNQISIEIRKVVYLWINNHIESKILYVSS